ncbi:hypothetical protein BRARA_J00651 [Brassica rapa]|uniref:Uncharacterized protein n=1 Tax=Brassica campestris TaxID=3711 RepID=A0A397XIP0_BRACM|nr:hypothetical protein BRARA_J00651 [Brassica rapa]
MNILSFFPAVILTYKKVWLHQVNCSVPALPSSGRLIKEALMWLAEDFGGKGGRSGRNIGRKRTGLAMSRLRLTHTFIYVIEHIAVISLQDVF